MSKPTQESCLENEVEGSFKRNKYITEKKTVKQTNKQTCLGVEEALLKVRLWYSLESETVNSRGRAGLKRDTTVLFKKQLEQYIWRPL